MKKMFFLFLVVSCAAIACADDMTDYCRDVVEPALAGVFAAKWTPRGPDAESIAAACTNVDWRIVRRRRSRVRDVWIGGTAPTNGTPWRLGVSRAMNGSFVLDGRLWPFETSPCAVTNTCATVAQAYALRRQKKYPHASKALRTAEACDPLGVWSAVERNFLEEDGEGAVAAAREGRARPDVSVSACRAAYLKIGATNEVRLIDRQLKQTGGK